MPRRSVMVVLCIVLVAVSCERKEPQARGSAGRRPPAASARVQMVRLEEGSSVYVAQRPVTVGHYVQYLTDTEQRVPDRWAAVEPGTREAELPVTGLTRDEAGLFALWSGMRLPTPEEWQKASQVVEERPYPWDQDGKPEPRSLVFLIQDQSPHGVTAAEEARRQFPGLLLGRYRGRTQELHRQLQLAVAAEEARRQDHWAAVKPALFAVLDAVKEHREAQVRAERMPEALAALKRVLLEKGRLARLKTGELPPDEAREVVDEYDRYLVQTFDTIEAVGRRLEDGLSANQDRAIELTRQFEERGASQLGPLPEAVTQALAFGTDPPATVAEAIALNDSLAAALDALAGLGPGFPGAPDPEELRARADQIALDAEALPGSAAAEAEIEDVLNRMQTIGEAVAQEFAREEPVVSQLLELVELRARREGTQARARALERVLQGHWVLSPEPIPADTPDMAQPPVQ
jgi:hypothetical protein